MRLILKTKPSVVLVGTAKPHLDLKKLAIGLGAAEVTEVPRRNGAPFSWYRRREEFARQLRRLPQA